MEAPEETWKKPRISIQPILIAILGVKSETRHLVELVSELVSLSHLLKENSEGPKVVSPGQAGYEFAEAAPTTKLHKVVNLTDKEGRGRRKRQTMKQEDTKER